MDGVDGCESAGSEVLSIRPKINPTLLVWNLFFRNGILFRRLFLLYSKKNRPHSFQIKSVDTELPESSFADLRFKETPHYCSEENALPMHHKRKLLMHQKEATNHYAVLAHHDGIEKSLFWAACCHYVNFLDSHYLYHINYFLSNVLVQFEVGASIPLVAPRH